MDGGAGLESFTNGRACGKALRCRKIEDTWRGPESAARRPTPALTAEEAGDNMLGSRRRTRNRSTEAAEEETCRERVRKRLCPQAIDTEGGRSNIAIGTGTSGASSHRRVPPAGSSIFNRCIVT